MELDKELELSYYKKIATLNDQHHVELVQHTLTNKIYVKKTLSVYDSTVYKTLFVNQYHGTPTIEALFEMDQQLIVIEEYMTGKTLREIIDERPLSEEETFQLIRDLCQILAPFHHLDPPIIHRDIKPSNLFITRDQQLVLFDFNAAKVANPSQSQDTVLIGTHGYAAPEQYGFLPSTISTDIYAIGILMNECLTQKLPNEKRDSGQLSNLIQQCIEIDPQKRLQNTEELLALLQATQETRTPEKKEEPSKEQKWKAWIIPGFRKKNYLVWILSFIGYIAIFDLAFSLESDNTPPSVLPFYRWIWFIIFILEIFWFGNYHHIWSILPLSRSEKIPVKIFGIILWGIFFIYFTLFFFVVFAFMLEK